MFSEAESVYKSLIGEGKDCVIKAMVLTGGRGLGHFSNGFKVVSFFFFFFFFFYYYYFFEGSEL